MACVTYARRRTRNVCWLVMGMVVGLLSNHGALAFVPTARTVSGGVSAVRRDSRSPMAPCGRTTSMAGTRSDGDGSCQHHATQHTKTTATPSWITASKTAATWLAAAAILSSTLSAGAAHASPTSLGDGLGNLEGMSHRSGAGSARAVMLLAEEDGGSASVDGRADVSQLLLELKKADRADTLLNSMVKINDVLEADEDGVLENPFAAESVVKGLIDKRRIGGEAWDSNTETAFGILKRKLDPYNVVLLRPYLKVAPFLGGLYYLAAFFVQQKFRDFFPFAYFGAVAVFVAPALIIVLSN